MPVALNMAVALSSSLSATEPVDQLFAVLAVVAVNAAREYCMIETDTIDDAARPATATMTVAARFESPRSPCTPTSSGGGLPAACLHRFPGVRPAAIGPCRTRQLPRM